MDWGLTAVTCALAPSLKHFSENVGALVVSGCAMPDLSRDVVKEIEKKRKRGDILQFIFELVLNC